MEQDSTVVPLPTKKIWAYATVCHVWIDIGKIAVKSEKKYRPWKSRGPHDHGRHLPTDSVVLREWL